MKYQKLADVPQKYLNHVAGLVMWRQEDTMMSESDFNDVADLMRNKPDYWPQGAVCWAQDEGGTWWAYKDIPVKATFAWRGDYIKTEHVYGQVIGNWRDALFIKEESNVSDGSMTNKAAETLRAALAHMDDRATTYDSESGERSMGKCVDMFNSLYGQELTEEQGWAFMCLLKIVRTSQGDFRADNYEDLAAYAGLMRESADKGDL